LTLAAKPARGALFGIVLFTGLGFSCAAQAAVSDWAVSDGGRMRIAALADGKGGYDALLDIEPNPGWKTYWLSPGDAGLPPLIDLAGSGNLTLARTDFPIPDIGEDEGGHFVGYHAPLGILLSLKSPDAAQPAMLKASVMIGVCKDICLPFQASFELALNGKDAPQADEFMTISLAKSALPEAASADFAITAHQLSPDGASLTMTLKLPSKSTPELALGPSPGLAFGPMTITPQPNGDSIVALPIKRRPKTGDVHVIVLVKSGARAMQTSLAIR
jgi:DsbC/DsbD-like thiol-disulfide interchange protein